MENRGAYISLIMVIIVLLVSYGTIVFYVTKQEPERKEMRRKEEAEVVLMRELLTAVYTLYKDKPNYKGISVEQLIRSGIIPKENIKEGRIVGYFGENIVVKEVNDGSKFAIVYEGLPEFPCARLIAYASEFPKYEGRFIQNEEYKHYNAAGLSAPVCSEENNKVTLIFK